MTSTYSEYKNSILIPDQSAWQQVSFWYTSCDITNFTDFFNENNIRIACSDQSAQELKQQIYEVNLFGIFDTSVTASETAPPYSVLSSINYVLTTANTGMRNFPIEVWNTQEKSESPYQQSLWDTAPSFQRMSRNKRGSADISNIILARELRKKNEIFFVFTNDEDQVKQCEIEGIPFMRPITLIIWMLELGYMKSRQKAVWVYEKMRKHNPRWVPKNKNFKDLVSHNLTHNVA